MNEQVILYDKKDFLSMHKAGSLASDVLDMITPFLPKE